MSIVGEQKKVIKFDWNSVNELCAVLAFFLPPSTSTIISFTPPSSHDVLSCPAVNLQIQEEDSSLSPHRQRAPGYMGGGEGGHITQGRVWH